MTDISYFYSSASTYTCLAIAVERYIGICRGATQSNSQICVKKARYYIFAILVISAVVDLPRFFELKPVTDKDGTDIDGVFEYTELFITLDLIAKNVVFQICHNKQSYCLQQ